MTTEDDTGPAVFLGEVAQRPHDAERQLHAGNVDRVDGVVPVQGLVLFALHDLDRCQTADPVGRGEWQKDLICDADHQVMIDELGRARRG